MLGIAFNVFRWMEYFVPELELGESGSEGCPRYGIAPKQPIGALPLLVHFVQVTDGRKILSLAPELSENRHADFLRLEVSRRIWWCVYTLDR